MMQNTMLARELSPFAAYRGIAPVTGSSSAFAPAAR